MEADERLEREIELISNEVNRLGCSHPAELSRVTLIEKERCVGVIWRMIKQNKLYRLKLHPDIVPIEMRRRLPVFWASGIHGFDMFGRMTFVIPKPQMPISEYVYADIGMEKPRNTDHDGPVPVLETVN